MDNVEGVCVDNGCKTSCKEHTCQGNYKGLDLKISHQVSLDYSESKSYTYCKKHGSDKGTALLVKPYGTAHGNKSRNTADRNIDTAGDHYDTKTAGKNDQVCVIIKYV